MSAPAAANPANIAAVQDILKEVWVSDTLESQLYEDTILLDWVEEVTEYTDSDGLKATVPLRTGRTGGIGARGVGEQLPGADHQRVAKATYNYKNLYLTVKVYGPVIARMETNRQAVVREVDLEVSNGIEDFKRDMCRQLWGDGTGRVTLAALPGNAASATVDLGADNYPVVERGWLYEGLAVDVGPLTNPDAHTPTSLRIVSVDDDSADPTITLSGSITPAAGDHVFVGGNGVDDTESNELNGMRNIVSDSLELGGLDPASATYWKSVVNDNGGTPRALSLSLMNDTSRRIRNKGGKKGLTDVIGDLYQEQEYYELLQSQVRFAGEAGLTGGNVEKPTYKGLAFTGDPDCPPERIFFLTKGQLQMFSAGEVAWQNVNTGGDILAWEQGYDAFVARAAKYCQVGTDRRRSLGVLEDLTSGV